MEIKRFQLTGKVENVLIANEQGTHISTPHEKVKFFHEYGVFGDNHYGPKQIDIRDSAVLRFGLPKGIECTNIRQWSAVSQEELTETSKLMSIPEIRHGLLGENLVISGIQDFSKLPPGTQLFFKSPKAECRTTILWVTGENVPCEIPGKAIQDAYPQREKLITSFIKHAKHRRGLVGLVYVSGFIKKGDLVTIVVPDQRIYMPPAIG